MWPLRNPASRVSGRSRREIGALVPALAVALLAGCQGDDGHASSVTTPTRFEECNYGPVPHADGAAISLALHWNGGEHSYDEGADLFVCVLAKQGGVVEVRAPDGVEVSPARQRVDPSGSGVLRFTVRVSPGASGQIEATTRSEDGGGTQGGPEIDANDDHWSFREPS